MSPFRARRAFSLGRFLRVNVTARSLLAFVQDVAADGHIDGTRPWSSISVGPRGFAYNTARRTARVDLPGPLSYETPPLGARAPRALPGRPLRYVTDAEALTVPCPRCGAEPDGRCRTLRTGRPTAPHAARIDRARTILEGDDRP